MSVGFCTNSLATRGISPVSSIPSPNQKNEKRVDDGSSHLIQEDDGRVHVTEKSPAYVVGERVIRPLIDKISSLDFCKTEPTLLIRTSQIEEALQKDDLLAASQLAASLPRPERRPTQFKIIEACLTQKNYSLAMEIARSMVASYEPALDRDEFHNRAFNDITKAFIRIDAFSDALISARLIHGWIGRYIALDLEQIIAGREPLEEALMRRYRYAGDFTKSEQAAQKITSQLNRAEALYHLAGEWSQKKEFSEAIRLLRSAPKIVPGAHLCKRVEEIALDHAKKNQVDRALELVEELLDEESVRLPIFLRIFQTAGEFKKIAGLIPRLESQVTKFIEEKKPKQALSLLDDFKHQDISNIAFNALVRLLEVGWGEDPPPPFPRLPPLFVDCIYGSMRNKAFEAIRARSESMRKEAIDLGNTNRKEEALLLVHKIPDDMIRIQALESLGFKPETSLDKK